MSDDESEKSYAIETFKHVLSSTAWSCLLKARFPDQVLQPIADPLENYLYGYSSNVFSEYFIAKNIANADERLDELQVTLCNAIDAAFSEVITARRVYRTNNDLDTLVGLSTTHAAWIMIDFAKLFAHREVDDAHHILSEKLSHILEEKEMMSWAKQFQIDLEQFFDGLENWTKFERLFFINRHLERWLMAFGIVVENQEDGQIYIHVPHGTDADYLITLQEEC